MEGRALAIVERAYRGALEEQYANILWLAHVLRRLRGEIDVLLRGDAVRYAVQEQPRSCLKIGCLFIDTLPHYETEIRNLLTAGVKVYASAKDCDRLHLGHGRLIPAVIPLDTLGVAQLFEEYAHIWHW